MAAGIGPETWFPVVTLVIGSALSLFGSALSDWRGAKRERQARLEQRRDANRLRRIEFQRTTLLELQEVVAQNLRFNGRAHFEDLKAFQASRVLGSAAAQR